MKFNNSYIRLPSNFYSFSNFFHFKNPKLISFNNKLGDDLDFKYSEYTDQELAEIFSGQKKLLGSEFISLVYAAHQFGHFVPRLGDGRAILIGEVLAKNGKRYDIQLKGSGPTAYSRRGDGFSALGPVLREYVLSEFMHTMNIPTTRALAAVATNEMVSRETILPGGVFTRVASSHIRIGTFQYFAAQNDLESLKVLLNYSIERHYPEIVENKNNQKEYPLLFLRKVISAQIDLVSSWMSIGFIHGVMNTDNMSISGETIDYGPCAFMDYFDFQKVYSFIDKNGRYSFFNQPQILAWNLARFAESLLPIVKDNFEIDEINALSLLENELVSINDRFENLFIEKLSKKLSLESTLIPFIEKKKLVLKYLTTLHDNNIDFTSSFRLLADKLTDTVDCNKLPISLNDFYHQWTNTLNNYKIDYKLAATKMNLINPLYIPRNHLIENMISSALKSDYSLFTSMKEVLLNPFDKNLNFDAYSNPPKQNEVVLNTFCGT